MNSIAEPMAESRRGPAGVRLAALLLAGLWLAGAASAATLRVVVGEEMVAALTDDDAIYLEAAPRKSEGLLAFSRRLSGGDAAADAIATENGGSRRLVVGVRYRVPYRLLLPSLQLLVIRGLFPDDEARPDGWLHKVAAGGSGRSLWRVAEWLVGDGTRFPALRAASGLADNEVAAGGSVLVPRALLAPVFAATLPPAPVSYPLEYVTDASGSYAVYRLRRGEALYSSVVVRFTGRTRAEDVNGYAAELVRLNRIPDVSDMPVGQPVRIPLDQLLPEFLPAGDPTRLAYEREREESDRFTNPVKATGLEGITVIVDAGHGGMDPGTMKDGVWEATYVYDVAMRVMSILQKTTAARIAPTTRDGDIFRIVDADLLPRSRGHAVLTTPRYPIADSRVGVNLRWYLANSVHRKAVDAGGDANKTVFVSIHAESLHPSLRGVMVYVPAASLTQGTFRRGGDVYERHQEVREKPSVSYSWGERVKSEGLSRQLAERIVAAFRRHDLAVHAEKPIRDRIIRGRRQIYVPAVLRYNAVPAKVLVEICNLNNSDDRRSLQSRAFRESVAQAIVDGILAYYGQSPTPPPAVHLAG